MDQRRLDFLNAVVGPDGARALAKAAAKSPELEWAILPRVIMSWLAVVGQGHYQGDLPGTGVQFAMCKSERGDDLFRGSVSVGDRLGDLYFFEDKSVYHVAGAVAIALGADPDGPELRSPRLGKLGKSIDLLVRSRTLRKAAQEHRGGAGGQAKAPGVPAAQRGPQEPEAPQATQPAQQNQQNQRQAKPRLPKLRVTKSEASRACRVCGRPQFDAGRYAGCSCFQALAKGVRTTAAPDGYTLEFGSAWDDDAVAALAENLKE